MVVLVQLQFQVNNHGQPLSPNIVTCSNTLNGRSVIVASMVGSNQNRYACMHAPTSAI